MTLSLITIIRYVGINPTFSHCHVLYLHWYAFHVVSCTVDPSLIWEYSCLLMMYELEGFPCRHIIVPPEVT